MSKSRSALKDSVVWAERENEGIDGLKTILLKGIVNEAGTSSRTSFLLWPSMPSGSYLVDPASSHMLVSKIKPCMSKYRLSHSETANGSLNQLRFLRSYNPTWITVVILELIHATSSDLSWEERFY